MLDVTDRLVVIIGGGAVAARKARGVIDSGGRRVRLVAPQFHPDVPGEVERLTASYEPAHLDGARLVFAATDSAAVNDAVVRDARARGVFACRADTDNEEPGDFVTPAKLVKGPVVVTVSAGSPALAARVRDGLAERFDPRWSALAEAMTALRPVVRGSSMPQPRRAEAFRALASDEALDLVDSMGPDGLLAWLRQRFPELRNG